MRDLVVSAYTPVLGSGRALRTYGIVRALAALRPVDLLYARFDASAPSREYRAIAGLKLHEVRPSRGPLRALAYARARTRAPSGFARGVSPELVRAARALARTPDRGRVVADGPIAAAALAQLARRTPIVYAAHNVESAFRHTAGDRDAGSRRALAAFERRLLRSAAECWMASAADVELARALAPEAKLRYVPNVVDVRAIEPATGRGDGILFVGDFSYLPNRTALTWLTDEVLPDVWEALPAARLTLAGRGLDGYAPADARIDVRGFVESLHPLYRAAGCVVVPLLAGGGSPLKFIEALAYRRPVVATPRAASGLDAVAGEHYVEAAEPAQFADAVVGVLRDGADEIAARGRGLAEARYSIESLVARVAA